MRARKIDSNQNEIVSGLRKMGVSVRVISMVGKGLPDILAGVRGQNFLLEIKDGKKSKSRKKLTDDEQLFFDTWKGKVYKIESIDDAIKILFK